MSIRKTHGRTHRASTSVFGIVFVVSLSLTGLAWAGSGGPVGSTQPTSSPVDSLDGQFFAKKKKKKKKKKKEEEPPPEEVPEEAPEEGSDTGAEADLSSGAGGGMSEGPGDAMGAPAGPSLQRGNRMEFDGRLIRGETAGAGAVFLFERAPRQLPSMVQRRTSYLDDSVVALFGKAEADLTLADQAKKETAEKKAKKKKAKKNKKKKKKKKR